MIEIPVLLWQLCTTAFRVIGIRGAIIIALLFAIAGIIAFYEGIPLVKSIPFISYAPGVGDVAIGHVQVKVNAAVTGAQHAYAIQVENAAAKAKADAEAESARQAAIITTEFNNRLASDQVGQDQISKDLNDALAKIAVLRAANGNQCPPGSKCPPGDDILDVLHKQGFVIDR